jgi:transaldolase
MMGTQVKERLKTKILVDGGDPEETRRMKSLLGFVDGQTTNPSLIAKNPEVQHRLATGHKFSLEEQEQEYKRIVQQISLLVGDGGVSIEVFADLKTTSEQMLVQGQDMFSWIPNAYIKYPCTHEGLDAAQMSVNQGIRVNITLCFSQEQAAGVYAATKTTKVPVYVSPFIGRLDDLGENGMDLIKNIQKMYQAGDGHVHVLAASIRSIDQLLACFALGVELVTVPTKVLEAWAAKGFPMPDQDFIYKGVDVAGNALRPIPYRSINLNQPLDAFDLRHDLTKKGIEKFVADFESTIRPPASVR